MANLRKFIIIQSFLQASLNTNKNHSRSDVRSKLKIQHSKDWLCFPTHDGPQATKKETMSFRKKIYCNFRLVRAYLTAQEGSENLNDASYLLTNKPNLLNITG